MFIARQKLSNALKSLKSKKSLQESTNRASERVPFPTSYLQLALAHARNSRVKKEEIKKLYKLIFYFREYVCDTGLSNVRRFGVLNRTSKLISVHKQNYNPEIFSFAREWYKCVTRLNMLQQTQENTPQVIFVSIRTLNQLRWRWSLFKYIMVEGEFRALWKNTQRETNTIAFIWLQNMLEHLSLDTLYSSQLAIFFELCSREFFAERSTDEFRERFRTKWRLLFIYASM